MMTYTCLACGYIGEGEPCCDQPILIPAAKQPKTERLHMKISADELRAIEDWRYANWVPSLSEAVRQLVKAGLSVEDEEFEIISADEWVARGLQNETTA